MIEAVNADPQARQDWLARYRSSKAQPELSKVIEALTPPTGKLKLARLERRRSSLVVEVDLPAGARGRLDLYLDPAEPGKISWVTANRTPTPYPQKPQRSPTADGLRKMVAERVGWAARRGEFSGAVLVVKGDEVLFKGAYGLAERDFASPNTLQTRFHLGSMDKMFTALAIGQLMEQGKISLDARLIDVLPDYPALQSAEAITIEQLLSHRAGLGSLFDRRGYDRNKRYASMHEILPAFASEPLAFTPGTSAGYSNEGFIVLGAVIEKLSGLTWYDYVQKNIFDRVGMPHTGYPTIDEITPARAVGYRYGGAFAAADSDYDDPLGYRGLRPNWDYLGYRGNACGGGYSTVGDMIAFLKALRSGQIVSAKTLETLTTVQPQGIGQYGMGFQNRLTTDERSLRGHDGGGRHAGINSDAKWVWGTNYAYAVLGNLDAPFAQTLGADIGAILAAQP